MEKETNLKPEINVQKEPKKKYYKPKKKNISAFSFGLGAQKTITENYVVGIECKFANFPRKNFTFNFNDAGETTLTSNFSYKMRSVALKVMYVF